MGGGRPPGCWWFIGFVRLRRSEGSAVWIGMTATTVVLVLLCMFVCKKDEVVILCQERSQEQESGSRWVAHSFICSFVGNL